MSKERITILFTFILFGTFGLTRFSHAASPVLNFSDLIDGPRIGLTDDQVTNQGAIVTVWGNNLGSSQGDSKVYIKDSQNVSCEAAHVYTWANATRQSGHPADLYTYHKMQFIQFSIPSVSADGSGKIYVSVGGVNSNELDFSIRSTGKIRFIKTTGADSGEGTWSLPWATMQYAVRDSTLDPGDIIYVCDGVIQTGGVNAAGMVVSRTFSGTSDATSYSLLAYPASAVTINATGTEVYNAAGIDAGYAEPNYWRFSRLSVRTNGIGIDPFGYMRAVANEITDYTCSTSQQGAFYGRYNDSSPNFSQGIKIFGNYIHNYGNPSCTNNQHHVIYLSNRNSPSTFVPWEIGWNNIKDTYARTVFHFYDENTCGAGWSGTTRIHDNAVENAVGPALDINSGCTAGYSTTIGTVEFYNNLLIKTGIHDANMAYGSVQFLCYGYDALSGYCFTGTLKMYNNTFYGYSDDQCGSLSTECGLITERYMNYVPGFHWEWRNNMVYDLYSQTYFNIWAGIGVNPTTHSNNLWYNGGDGNPASPPSWDIAPITTDPLFTNAAGGNFSLQSGSPAIGVGYDIRSIAPRDFLGNPRPATPSIGAFEYAQSGSDKLTPQSPTSLSVR